MVKTQMKKKYQGARESIAKRCKAGGPAWVRPLKAFHNELWLHYGMALLMLGMYLAGLVSESVTLLGIGLGAAAGSSVAIVLMRGYKVCENEQGEKLAVIERWSVLLRGIYLSSRALAIGLFRSPWPGVASLGGSVVVTIIVFQVVQGVYLHFRLPEVG